MGVDTKWLAKHFEEQEARMSDTTVTITSETFEYMADRIEELEAKLAACEKYRDAYAECDRIGTQAVRDLEAKLAKAVEWAEKVREYAISWDDKYLSERSNEILAELTSSEAANGEAKGGKDE